MKKIRIALILPSNKGTIARRANDLYWFLINRNASVYVIVLNNSPQPEFQFPHEYIFKTSLELIPAIKILIQGFWLRKIKKNIKPDITINTLSNCSIVSLLSGGKDVKIGMFRAPIEQNRDWNKNRRTTNIAYRYFFPKLSKLYCVSDEVRLSINNNYPQIPRHKIETVYNPFDNYRIENLGNEEVFEKEFNTHKVIVCVGRIEKIKGYDRIITAYSLLEDYLIKQSKIVFIGRKTPHYFPVIEALITRLGIENNVLFLDHQSNPYKYVKRSNIFVLSSLQEGLPGALIEALVLKTPVIATNCSLGVWEAMGVKKNHSRNLQGVYRAPSGYITSNLAFLDYSKNDMDVSNMLKALTCMLTCPKKNYDFSCADKFNSETIIDRFINP